MQVCSASYRFLDIRLHNQLSKILRIQANSYVDLCENFHQEKIATTEKYNPCDNTSTVICLIYAVLVTEDMWRAAYPNASVISTFLECNSLL